jgi:predicted adenine nucleotide alpha hydrolase (AANH) superfamily ATPase
MMNTEKGGKRKAGKRRAQTNQSKKEDKATKESNIHSHDHCGNAFSLQKEEEKTQREVDMHEQASIMLPSATTSRPPSAIKVY